MTTTTHTETTETTDETAATVAYLTLPKGAKPSKVASKDATRPILTSGNVTRDKGGAWFLEVTDSYCLTRLPLGTVGDVPEDWQGMVSRDVLVALEKRGAGAFSITDAGVEVRNRDQADAPVVAILPALVNPGKFPDCAQLIPDVPTDALRVGLNPALLAAVDAASGAGKHDPAVLTFDLASNDAGGCYLRAIRVECAGAVSVVMPIRVPPAR